MNFQLKVLLTALFSVFLAVQASAQITNDSTKMLFGPHSTRVFREQEFLRGNYTESPIDTSINNTYSSLYWFGDTIFQQTLGNIGLATQPLNFQYSNQIGARPGRNAFDYYAYQSNKLLYYDTRSPYSKLNYIQGTLGEGIFEAEINRNIRKWWNAGFAFNRILANKQIGATTRKDGAVDHVGFKVYTHLQSTNNRYHLFANYLLQNQIFVESGGVRPVPGDTQDSLFNLPTEDVNLRQSTGRDIRHTFHIGQSFAIFKEKLKLFNEFDQIQQFDRFDDQLLEYTIDSTGGQVQKTLFFFPNKINYDTEHTHDRTTYTELQNTFGITGNQTHYFYKAYLKYRSSKWDIHKPDPIYPISDLPFTQRFNQFFAGGEVEGRINKRMWGAFRTEYKPSNEYFIQGELQFLFLKLTQTQVSASPTLFEKTYFGNSYNWNNNFENTITDRTALQIQGAKWHNSLRLELATTSLSNYIIFNQGQQPQQIDVTDRLYTATLDHKLVWGKFHWENLVVYTNTTNVPFIRIPDWFIDTKAYFQGFIFKKALFGQIGLETTYRSGYFGDAYSPALQHYYLQDNFKLDSYPVFDVFVSTDIKSVNIFLKLAHANDGINGPGYFTTPYYPGMRRSFLFGVKWLFFD